MAKTPKVKKREVSFRSRAARRGEEPVLKDAARSSKPAKDESDYKPWLHSAQSAGVQKKQKKKQLTRGQKLRQQKGLEKADAIVARTEKKVEDSKNRARRVDARRADWEKLNEEAVAALEAHKRTKGKVAALQSRDAVENGKGGDEEDAEILPDLEQPLLVQDTEMSRSAVTTPAQAVDAPKQAWESMHADTVDEVT